VEQKKPEEYSLKEDEGNNQKREEEKSTEFENRFGCEGRGCIRGDLGLTFFFLGS